MCCVTQTRYDGVGSLLQMQTFQALHLPSTDLTSTSAFRSVVVLKNLHRFSGLLAIGLAYGNYTLSSEIE